MSDYDQAFKYGRLAEVYKDAYWKAINIIRESRSLELQGYLNRELFELSNSLSLQVEQIEKEASNERKEV